MVILKSVQKNSTVFTLEGKLTAANVHQFRAEIEQLAETETNLAVLDLQRLREIDSSGIGAIIAMLKVMRAKDGEVKILRLRGEVKRIFELLRIDRSIAIHENLSEVVQ